MLHCRHGDVLHRGGLPSAEPQLKPLLPLLLVLSGCASIAEDRATWYGASVEEVHASWGKPQSTSKLPDGAEVQTWVNESPSGSGASVGVGVGVFRSSGNVGIGAGTGVSVPVGERAPNNRCERKATIRDGRVFDMEWNGQPERACAGYQKPK